MIQSKTRWKKREIQVEKANQIQSEFGLSPLVSAILSNRQIGNNEELDNFLNPKMNAMHDPFLFSQMKIARDRVLSAIENEEKIMIYGDYDADGITSTAILIRAIRDLGGNVDFYIPNRFTEGYGPNEAAFCKIWEQQYTLLITVDNGIAGIKEMKLAKEMGLDVILTDHHEFKEEIPEALAIIHPKSKVDHYPFHELCGAGVALKLAQALHGRVKDEWLELAAIGTICDLVPLMGENRIIVKHGLKRLMITKNQGLKALLQYNQVEPHTIDEETVGFIIGPRLNAAGRLQDAGEAVELCITDDYEFGLALAEKLDRLNRERQVMVQEMTRQAIEMARAQLETEDNYVIVLAKEGWNPGVVGIVASKIVTEFYRPTIILGIQENGQVAKGSGRSIEGFDLHQSLKHVEAHLIRFGGHPMAAGLTLDTEELSKVRRALNNYAKTFMTEEDFVPVTEIDLSIPMEHISIQALTELKKLSPFGVCNPKPTVCIENVRISQSRVIGSQSNHLKLQVTDSRTLLDCIGFHFGYLGKDLKNNKKISLIGSLSINEWNNIQKPQIMIQDIKECGLDVEILKQLKNIDSINQFSKPRVWVVDNESINHPLISQFKEDTFIVYQSDLEKLMLKDSRYETMIICSSNIFSINLPIKELLHPQGKIYILSACMSNEQMELPERKLFIDFYQKLTIRKEIHSRDQLNILGEELSCDKDLINFMLKVFFELDFATISNGKIIIRTNPPKKELTHSQTYCRLASLQDQRTKFVNLTKEDWEKWLVHHAQL